ncbi:MAG: hypothetical protein ACRCU3_04065 [Eubacteriaceae bacterium]
MEIKKKKLTTIVLSIGLLCLVAGSALAYLTANTAPVSNQFTFLLPKIGVNIIERNSQGNPLNPEKVEFATNEKRVFLENPTLTNPDNLTHYPVKTVNRVMFVPMFKDGDYGTEGLTGDFTKPDASNQMQLGEVTFYFPGTWETDWFFKDGYFYYRKVLEPGQISKEMLRGVTMSGPLEGRELHVEVLVDAIEADPTVVLDAWGLTLDGTTLKEPVPAP